MAIKVRSEAEIEWRPDFDVKEENIQDNSNKKQQKQKLIIMILNIYTCIIFIPYTCKVSLRKYNQYQTTITGIFNISIKVAIDTY